MRMIVTGCRAWASGPSVLDEVIPTCSRFDVDEILVGDCPTGVDAAIRLNVDRLPKVTVFEAKWELLGRKAGPIRNQAMVDAGAGLCLAFWDGESRGTLDCLTRCVKAGIPVRIIPKRVP